MKMNLILPFLILSSIHTCLPPNLTFSGMHSHMNMLYLRNYDGASIIDKHKDRRTTWWIIRPLPKQKGISPIIFNEIFSLG